jgi:hypothetical protein
MERFFTNYKWETRIIVISVGENNQIREMLIICHWANKNFDILNSDKIDNEYILFTNEIIKSQLKCILMA